MYQLITQLYQPNMNHTTTHNSLIVHMHQISIRKNVLFRHLNSGKFIALKIRISTKFFVLFHGIYSKHSALFQTKNKCFDGDCDDLIRNKRWAWKFSFVDKKSKQSINNHFPNFLPQTIQKFEKRVTFISFNGKERKSLKETKRNRVD